MSSYELTDERIDAELRDVEIPTALAERLRLLATWPDRELDSALGGVPVPSILSQRLKEIVADEVLDGDLVAVDVPENLAGQIRSALADMPTRLARRRSIDRAALQSIAALLLLTLGLGYASLAWQVVSGIRPRAASVPTFVFVQPARIELLSSRAEDDLQTTITPGDEPMEFVDTMVPVIQAPWQEEESPPADGPVGELLDSRNRESLTSALSRLRWPALGAPQYDHRESHVWQIARLPEPRGVLAPLVPGYDRAFLLRSQVHPPISPSPENTLNHSLAPMNFETASYDEALRAIRAGSAVPTDIRVEDFISALDYDLPVPAQGELGLSLMTCPSPLGPANSKFLAVGVSAGMARKRIRESTHLVVAIDFSESLGRSGDWQWVREALLEYVERLDSNDRMSVLVFDRDILLRTMPLARESLGELTSTLQQIVPRRECDLSLGVATAIDHALAAETPSQSQHLVLLTDGRNEISPFRMERLRILGDELSPTLGLTVIDCGGNNGTDRPIVEAAKLLKAEIRPATSRRKLLHALLAATHGDSGVVASEARAIVRFNPDAVRAYRLVGHEANAMAHVVSPSSEVELHAGDESLTLFEILPQPSKSDDVVQVELNWVDAARGEPRSLLRKVSQSELLQPWDSAPLSLRRAVIGSEVAQWLHGSRSALRELGWISEKAVDPETLTSQLRRLVTSAGDPCPEIPALQSIVNAAAKLRGRSEFRNR